MKLKWEGQNLTASGKILAFVEQVNGGKQVRTEKGNVYTHRIESELPSIALPKEPILGLQSAKRKAEELVRDWFVETLGGNDLTEDQSLPWPCELCKFQVQEDEVPHPKCLGCKTVGGVIFQNFEGFMNIDYADAEDR